MKTLLIVTLISLFVSTQVFASSQIEGKITNIDVANGQYSILENETGQIHVLDFKASTSVRINSRRYRNISKLSVGDSVIYKKTAKDKKKKYVKAKIKKLHRDEQKITFVDTKTGALKTYKYEPEPKNKAGQLDASDIQPGQQVVLEIVSK